MKVRGTTECAEQSENGVLAQHGLVEEFAGLGIAAIADQAIGFIGVKRREACVIAGVVGLMHEMTP